jgi:hypothetical protein
MSLICIYNSTYNKVVIFFNYTLIQTKYNDTNAVYLYKQNWSNEHSNMHTMHNLIQQISTCVHIIHSFENQHTIFTQEICSHMSA